MIEYIEKKLSEMTTARLVKIVLAALDEMSEKKQVIFIARHIDAQTSLKRLGADDSGVFLNEVEEFCQGCLDGAFYTDEEDIHIYFSENNYGYSHHDEWDYDEFYNNTEWAKNFTRLFNLSMMHIRSGGIATGYVANARLLSCLEEVSSNDSYLGTDCPISNIKVNWDELFALHYDALFKYHTDQKQAIEMAFNLWMFFGVRCEEGFLDNVKDIVLAECRILEGLKNAEEWACQRQCFELLERLYARLGKNFDKVSQAKALVNHNIYFYLFVVKGFCEQAYWQDAVEAANIALPQIPFIDTGKTYWTREQIQNDIRAAIQTKLADAYENLLNFAQAFEAAKIMFLEAPKFALYKRARSLAEKGPDASAFLSLIEECEKRNVVSRARGFETKNLLCEIYSYEGEIEKMLNLALSQDIDRNYYDRKYIALSLIYRAVNGESGIGKNLSEYLTSAAGQDAIEDMIGLGDNRDAARQADLLRRGANLMMGMMALHIGGGNRSSYAKAAYYMCVLRDIFVYLKQEDDFRSYFKIIIMENNRRPALRDEMRIVYGKEATMIKKIKK